MSSKAPESTSGLGVLARALGIGAAWLIIYLSGPGIFFPAGSALGAPLGVAVWAYFASRPGRAAFGIEWMAACAAWCGICSWAALVHWTSLLFIGPGFGMYYACSGLLLRRLARDWPLAIAAPAAWMFIETIRSLPEPPFGLNWMRLGIHWHDVGWLAGSARIWGVWGLSFSAAALAGGLADFAVARGLEASAARTRRRWALIAGGGPLLLAALFSVATAAPKSERGPRVLLVQPGIPQERKMEPGSREELYRDGVELTLQGLDEARRAGERPIDLVAWGESMLPLDLIDPALHEAVLHGARPAPWFQDKVDEEYLRGWERLEDGWVRRGLLHAPGARPGLLPAGTVFVSGVVALIARDQLIGRLSGVALWNADGTRGAPVGKQHLVPAAETMLGLEKYAAIRDTIFKLAGYIPDLLAHIGSRCLRFKDRDGREYVFGAAVCFDNAYDGPFVEPLLEGPVDFHLIASNEAWFQGDQENDQMMAFSRLAAIATGRSIVRATNSGISAVLDPGGKETARLISKGRDREVAGTLRADIPVPVASDRARNTIYVRTWRLWPALALLWPVLLILDAGRRRRGYSRTAAG